MYSIIQTAKDFGLDVGWAVSRRKEYLIKETAKLETEQNQLLQAFSGNNELNRFLLLDSLKWLKNRIQRFANELEHKGRESSGSITQADIEKARQFPLESLLPNVRNGKTRCISGTHEDKHPSMDVRNGFAYCYSCGFHGDAITICMKVDGVDFVTAIKKLNC